MIGNVSAVFVFEWKRALTVPRLAWWAVLAAFPVFIVGLIRFTAEENVPREVWAGVLFALVPMLVSMMGTLLWTTPAISAELEQRSWVYLSVRPNGGTAVLIGKYLAAVAWVIPPAMLGLTIAVLIADSGDGWRLWWTMFRLVCLSCPSFGAIYLLLGILLPRRAMVLAVAYSLILELIVAWVPAVINKLTIQYRLRALLVQWCDLAEAAGRQSGVLALIGDAPAWQHVGILLLVPPTLLVVGIALLHASEFATSVESDV